MLAEQPAKGAQTFKTDIVANLGNRFIGFKNQLSGFVQAFSGKILIGGFIKNLFEKA